MPTLQVYVRDEFCCHVRVHETLLLQTWFLCVVVSFRFCVLQMLEFLPIPEKTPVHTFCQHLAPTSIPRICRAQVYTSPCRYAQARLLPNPLTFQMHSRNQLFVAQVAKFTEDGGGPIFVGEWYQCASI